MYREMETESRDRERNTRMGPSAKRGGRPSFSSIAVMPGGISAKPTRHCHLMDIHTERDIYIPSDQMSTFSLYGSELITSGLPRVSRCDGSEVIHTRLLSSSSSSL
jgi:hypothetical protein